MHQNAALCGNGLTHATAQSQVLSTIKHCEKRKPLNMSANKSTILVLLFFPTKSSACSGKKKEFFSYVQFIVCKYFEFGQEGHDGPGSLT